MRPLAMLALLLSLLPSLRSVLRVRAELALEKLVLRQQLAALHRSTPRPRLRPTIAVIRPVASYGSVATMPASCRGPGPVTGRWVHTLPSQSQVSQSQ